MSVSSRNTRRAYAETIADIAGVRNGALVDAFAAVPREAFLGPGPWKVMVGSEEEYRDTPDDDPVHVYENACIAIDPARALNNGESGLHMGLLDILTPVAGEHVVQIGAGTGYYTAILAELVGRPGLEGIGCVAMGVGSTIAYSAGFHPFRHQEGGHGQPTIDHQPRRRRARDARPR